MRVRGDRTVEQQLGTAAGAFPNEPNEATFYQNPWPNFHEELSDDPPPRNPPKRRMPSHANFVGAFNGPILIPQIHCFQLN